MYVNYVYRKQWGWVHGQPEKMDWAEEGQHSSSDRDLPWLHYMLRLLPHPLKNIEGCVRSRYLGSHEVGYRGSLRRWIELRRASTAVLTVVCHDCIICYVYCLVHYKIWEMCVKYVYRNPWGWVQGQPQKGCLAEEGQYNSSDRGSPWLHYMLRLLPRPLQNMGDVCKICI